MATSSKPEEPQTPRDLVFNELVSTIRCHPSSDLIASGLIDGTIYIHSFSNTEESQEKAKISFHKKACRALRFSENGRRLFSISKDKSFCCTDSETGRLKRRIKNAHEAPIYSMALSGENFVATGDDDGVLKVWDIRTKDCVMEFKECSDFISDMIAEDKKFIIASSGEGTLTSFNLRRKRMELQSELFDAEMSCLARMKRGEKLLCGSSAGVLNVFNWNQWGNISDRIPIGDDPVDSLQAVTDNLVCVGTTDGHIKAVHVFPNRILGEVGRHEEDFPVEALSLTADESHVASCSHDMKVKFWNIDGFKRQRVDTSKRGTKLAKKRMVKSSIAKKTSFFADLAGDSAGAGVNSDSDEDSEEEEDDDDESGDNESDDDDDSD